MTGVELARRAVACPGWRWMPGMRYQIVNERGQIGGWMRASDRVSHLDALYPVAGESEVALPDLDDPATLGCLLALVREAWGSHVSSIRTGDGWSVRHMGRDGWAVGLSVVGITPCEAEALVAALEAAPRREAAPC